MVAFLKQSEYVPKSLNVHSRYFPKQLLKQKWLSLLRRMNGSDQYGLWSVLHTLLRGVLAAPTFRIV